MLLPFANAPGAAGGSGTVTSVSVATANGFSGTVANPTTTPDITIIAGAITPTSVNGLTITSSTGTLTITNLKTLTIDNSLELAGTDSTKMTFPGASDTIAGLGTIQTFTAAQTFNSGKLILAGSGSGTTTLNASAAASGVLTLPAATDTLVGKATTDALTNKDLTSGTNTFPTFNQNTTGSAATLTTTRTLWGQNFNGSANVTGSLTSVGDITGGASSMIITAGTGNSRTLTLKSTTSGGSATTFLTGNADQSSTFGGNISGTGAWTLTGGAGNMTIISGTGNSRTMILQTTTSGGVATTALTLGADQSATFAGHLVVEGVTSTGATGTGKFVFDASPTISGHPTIEGVTSTGATGTGKFVFDGSPTLVTPTLGVATVTSINKMAITAPTTAATLAFGTDNATITFQGTDTYVGRATTDTLTNKSMSEAQLTFTDITTGNVSTSAHGFAPKAPNDTTKFLRGDATYAAPISSTATSTTQNTSSTTTSTTYTSTLADAVTTSLTVTTGTHALVCISALISNSAGGTSIMSYAISGATTLASDDFKSLQVAGTNGMEIGLCWVETSLTAGSNTFTIQYRVSANTGTFNARKISVVPL